jgi:hypothetical protein
MFLYGWLVVLGTSVSGLVIYARDFALSTTFLVLATLIAFAAGTYSAPQCTTAGDQPFGRERDKVDGLTLTFLCLLAAVGALIVLQEMWQSGFALLENFNVAAEQQRNTRWLEFNAGEVEVTPVRAIGVAACLAVATLLPAATKQRRRTLKVASAISAIVVAADALLSVGRFNFGVLAICLLISGSLTFGGQTVRRIFTLRRLIIGVPIAVYFLVIFPVQRSQNVAASAQRALNNSGDGDFPEWVLNISNIPGMGWFEIFAYSSSYFSGALNKLNYFLTATDVFSWYEMGRYNLLQYSQAIGATEGGITPWHQIRLDIAAVLNSESWSLNPWSTGIRDLGIDFGLMTVPVVFVLGYLAQTAYNKSVAGRSYVGLITATYVPVSCFLFAFISPFQIRILSNGFWLLAALALAHWFVAGKAAASTLERAGGVKLESQPIDPPLQKF